MIGLPRIGIEDFLEEFQKIQDLEKLQKACCELAFNYTNANEKEREVIYFHVNLKRASYLKRNDEFARKALEILKLYASLPDPKQQPNLLKRDYNEELTLTQIITIFVEFDNVINSKQEHQYKNYIQFIRNICEKTKIFYNKSDVETRKVIFERVQTSIDNLVKLNLDRANPKSIAAQLLNILMLEYPLSPPEINKNRFKK